MNGNIVWVDGKKKEEMEGIVVENSFWWCSFCSVGVGVRGEKT